MRLIGETANMTLRAESCDIFPPLSEPLEVGSKMLGDRKDVLVPASTKVSKNDAVLRHRRRHLTDGGNRVTGLQRGNNALSAAKQLKSGERFGVGR